MLPLFYSKATDRNWYQKYLAGIYARNVLKINTSFLAVIIELCITVVNMLQRREIPLTFSSFRVNCSVVSTYVVIGVRAGLVYS